MSLLQLPNGHLGPRHPVAVPLSTSPYPGRKAQPHSGQTPNPKHKNLPLLSISSVSTDIGPRHPVAVPLSPSPYPGRKTQPPLALTPNPSPRLKTHQLPILPISSASSDMALVSPSAVSLTDSEPLSALSSPILMPVDSETLEKRQSTEEITFTNWINDRLKTGRSTLRLDVSSLLRVTDLSYDLRDGVVLIKLLESLTKKKIKGYNKAPKHTAQKMVNLDLLFKFLDKENVRVVGIGSHNIFDGNRKLILGLIWTLIQKYQLKILGTHVSTKQVIIQWLQALLPTWNISNLNTDWSSGGALIALINEVKPGVGPMVSTLDITKRRANCILGLKVAHDHLKIPKLISADDLADSSIDEMSMMTYLSYFVEPAKTRLLKWLKKRIPQMTISDFVSDWADGRALVLLVESLFPGLLQSLGDAADRESVEVIKQTLDTCKKRMGIESPFTAEQLARAKVEELQVMTYLLRIKAAKLKALPDEIKITGDGIRKATTLKAATFEVDASEAGPGKLSIDAYYENGQKVKFSFNEIALSIARLTYTPPSSGLIYFDILWSDIPIPNSPFEVSVTDSTLVKFIDFEHHSRLARVNIPITLSLETKNAGPGTLTACLDYSDGMQVHSIVKREPNSVVTLQYTPPKAGKPTLRVFWNKEELRHLSVHYSIVDSGNYRVAKMPEKKIYRTLENTTFTVESDGAPLHVLQMTAFLDDLQIPIRFKIIDGVCGEATFTPTIPGVYRVEVACVDRLVVGSPFEIEVIDPSMCKLVGVLPKHLKLGVPYKFEIDLSSAGDGPLDFVSADSGGNIPFSVVVMPIGVDRVQVIEVTPQKSGDYLVGISFHGVLIPGSPFRVIVCDPNKCRASGDVISKKTAAVGKPLEFRLTVLGQNEEVLKPTVKATGPSAKYTAEIHNIDDHTFNVRFIPWEIGSHKINIQYGGFDIPKSPFHVDVTGFDSSGISATGSGLQEAFTGVPAQFVIVAKQDGLLDDGTLQIRVVGVVNNVECKVRARDNRNGTYNVAYLTQVPGAYLVSVIAHEQHIPGSPFRLSASPGPDAENCYMYGPALEPTSVLTIGKPIEFIVNTEEGGTGTLSVKAVGPGGTEARVYKAKGEKKGTQDIMLDPIRSGKYRVNVKWSNKHIQGSPFILKIFPGADASKCRAYGPGLEDGLVGKSSYFTIETRDAGAGTLKVRLHGVKDAFKIDIKPADQRDVRTLVARYDPRLPGEYLVTIKWCEANIPGSPFRVKIVGEALMTEEEVKELRQRATPLDRGLDTINEQDEDEQVAAKPTEKPSKNKKKGKGKSKEPASASVNPHTSRQPFGTFSGAGLRAPPGAGRVPKNPQHMMTFNGLQRKGGGRSHHRSPTAPGTGGGGVFHGQASMQMNTYTTGQIRQMKRSKSK